MSSYAVINASVFDGTGSDPEPKEVLIEGDRITAVEDRLSAGQRERAQIIDGAGAVLMPGLVDGHTHLGFGSSVEHISDRSASDETKILLIAHSARVMLDHGFTSCYSGGNRTPKAELAVRDAINEGWMPGPRLRAASWEGSAGIISPDHPLFPGTEDREADPEAISQFVHAMADLGVSQVKLTLTGESAVIEGTSRIMQFTEDEVAAASAAARERGVALTAHAHSAEAVSMAAKYGIRAIYHASFSDAEAIDALVEARDHVFVAPTPGILWAHIHDEEHPPTEGMETPETIESVSKVAPELHRRGVRLVIGGDYGFPFNPVGKNARDLRLFVEWFGLTPGQALQCATQNGGLIMGMGDELGLVKPGYIADLLLVDGDPTEEITLMEDPGNFRLIMQSGRPYKLDPARTAVAV